MTFPADSMVAQLRNFRSRSSEAPFDPEGSGYDMDRAVASGMKPQDVGDVVPHWGSVAPASPEERQQFGLPEDSYVLLKGRGHKTWNLAVEAEEARGSKVVKFGQRYFSVPRSFGGGQR